MEDSKIIDLYWQRDERAITETNSKYGTFCQHIAMNLLDTYEDAEECVSDTYHQAWIQIPPQRPDYFRAWLGKIVRNISINLWNKSHAKKRDRGMNLLLDELADCIPTPQEVEQDIAYKELGALISAWLWSLPKEDRILFVQRYWYGISLNDLARYHDIAAGKLAQKMYRLRLALKTVLEKEGICL